MSAAVAIPIVLGAASVGTSLYGAIKQSGAESSAAEEQKRLALQNAILSRQQAGEDERVFRVQTRKALGEMRTMFGASGLRTAGSSAEDVIGEAAANAELDALKIRHGGEIRALGFQSDANLANMRAKAFSSGGYLSAAGYLLGGGSKIASNIDWGGGGGNNSSAGTGAFISGNAGSAGVI